MGLLTSLNALGGGGDSLPSQTGNNGKFLTTDGSNPSWASISGGGDMLAANNLSDLASASTARSNLGLGTVATHAVTEFLLASSNLSDLASASTARTNLGLGTLATQNGTFSGTSSGTNTGDQTITLTGDVTGSGSGSFAATIASDAVTNAKLANMATATIKGRTSAGTGDPEDLSATQATALLNSFVGDSGSGGTKGLVPAPSAGDAAANKFLKANGSWDTVAGGGSGDVTSASTIGDNKLVRGDGGAKGIQQSGITIDDSNNMSGVHDIVASGNITAVTGGIESSYLQTDAVLLNNSGYIVSGDAVGNNFTICAYDVDGISNTAFITLTSNNTPTCDLADSVTKAGSYIYRAGGTDVPVTDGGTGASTATTGFNNLAPTTTKGDVIVHNGTNNVRVGVGANGTVLVADSTQSAGVKWDTVAGGSYTDEQAQDAVGTILTDTSTIDFTYDDVTPQITASVKSNSVTAGLLSASATDKIFGRATAGAGAGEEITCTATARSLLDDTSTSAMRTTLGLAIGTDVQAYDADLDTWATKTAPSGTPVGTSDTQTLTNKTLTSPVISSISNTGTSTVPTSTGTLTNRTAGVFDASLTATIAWDGTAPSGTSNLRYSWQQFGGWVFAQFRLEYATAGATNTQVSIVLPSDMPSPVDFTGTDNTEVMLAGSGNAYTSMTSSGSAAKVVIHKDSGSATGYYVWCRGFTSGAMKGAVMFVAYPCVSGSRL